MKHLLLSIILLAAAHCQAAPILPEEAKSHVGENVSIRGMVEQPPQRGDLQLPVDGATNGRSFLRSISSWELSKEFRRSRL